MVLGSLGPLKQGAALGFTLLELVAATALAAGLAAAALPAWSDLRAAARREASARQIIVTLDTARTRAIATNTEQRVAFAIGSGAIRSYADANPGGATTTEARLPDGVTITSCSAPGAEIHFTPRGTAARFGTIVVGDASGGQHAVVVSITGRVRSEPR